MPTELVILDCDGVMIDSEVISARMLIEELAERGVEVDLPFVMTHFLGRSYSVVLEEVRSSFGVKLPEGFEADYRKRLLAVFERELRPMSGVYEFLERLAVPKCLATSSSPARVQRSLELVGLADYFKGRVFTSSQVERGKPAPDLFLFAARNCGADPASCLVLEDSITGVRAARAAGMEVWRFVGGSHFPEVRDEEPEDARPDQTIASFQEFYDLRPELDLQERRRSS